MSVSNRNNMEVPQPSYSAFVAAANDLQSKIQQAISDANQNLASTTYTDMTGMSLTVTLNNAGEEVILSFACAAEQSAANDEWKYRFVRDGVQIDEVKRCNGVASAGASAIGQQVGWQYYDAPGAAGTYVYKVQFARESGAGNLDVKYRRLQATTLQVS